MPPNTVCVTRPGKHGNPFFPGCGIGFGYFDEKTQPVQYDDRDPAQCVQMFRIRMRDIKECQPEKFEAMVAPLRGKNVACWCVMEAPCHGDVWLELANP